jgi:hypothetical protein
MTLEEFGLGLQFNVIAGLISGGIEPDMIDFWLSAEADKAIRNDLGTLVKEAAECYAMGLNK